MEKLEKKDILYTILPTVVSLAVVVIAVAAVLVIKGAAASYRSIRVIELKGEVSVDREGVGNLEPSVNMNLISGDRISTSKDAYVVLRLDEDKYVMLGEQGAIQVLASGNADNGRTEIHLEIGTVLNNIQNPLSQDSTYEIVTPSATMSVRGTVFEARWYPEDNVGELLTYEGSVALTLKNMDPVMYVPGEYTQFGTGDVPRFLVEREAITDERMNLQMVPFLYQIDENERDLDFGEGNFEELVEQARKEGLLAMGGDKIQTAQEPAETPVPETNVRNEEESAPAPGPVERPVPTATPTPSPEPAKAPAESSASASGNTQADTTADSDGGQDDEQGGTQDDKQGDSQDDVQGGGQDDAQGGSQDKEQSGNRDDDQGGDQDDETDDEQGGGQDDEQGGDEQDGGQDDEQGGDENDDQGEDDEQSGDQDDETDDDQDDETVETSVKIVEVVGTVYIHRTTDDGRENEDIVALKNMSLLSDDWIDVYGNSYVKLKVNGNSEVLLSGTGDRDGQFKVSFGDDWMHVIIWYYGDVLSNVQESSGLSSYLVGIYDGMETSCVSAENAVIFESKSILDPLANLVLVYEGSVTVPASGQVIQAGEYDVSGELWTESSNFSDNLDIMTLSRAIWYLVERWGSGLCFDDDQWDQLRKWAGQSSYAIGFEESVQTVSAKNTAVFEPINNPEGSRQDVLDYEDSVTAFENVILSGKYATYISKDVIATDVSGNDMSVTEYLK